MRPCRPIVRSLASAIALSAAAVTAHAAIVSVTVTIENLAPAEGIAFAPLHVGFANGTFDAFNNGEVATAPIISVAEGGSGSLWQPAFGAAEPLAVRGTIGGLLLSGAMASSTFTVNTVQNPFFTFASMVVPSNDFFIGNDSATRFRLFDADGNLLLAQILQEADDIWDAGSELFDPAAAAFVGDNDLRTPQGGVVSFNFSELEGFNGFTTGAGYTFMSNLRADTPIFRISFDSRVIAVPAPASAALAGLGLLALPWLARRRTR